jgi:hypothetical protein
MTGAQASYLKTLTEQLGEPDKFSQALTKAEAFKRIDELKASLERNVQSVRSLRREPQGALSCSSFVRLGHR